MSSHPVERPTGWPAAIALLLAAAVVLSGWLLAAPPGASPDDGYHLGSIWCAEGFQDGLCVEDLAAQDSSRALVPQAVLSIACFTYDGALSAACQLEALDSGLQRLVPAVTNINGERPTLYYRTMHRLIGDGQDVAMATARIRVANVVVTLVLVALTALLAHPRLRTAFLLSWTVTVVPLGLFLLTSVNTSAWGIAGLTTAWANVVTARDHPTRRNRLLAGALAIVGIVMALGSRTEAVAHIGIIAVALAAMWGSEHLQRTGWRWRDLGRREAVRITVASVIALLLGAILVALAPRSADLGDLLSGLRSGYSRIAARDIGEPILAIAFEVPTLWGGALGNIWGLGALDTPIPSLASFPLMGVYVGLVAVGLLAGARARTIGVTLLFAALFALPTFSLLRAGLLVYESLQPRQFMVILFPLLGLALYRLRGEASFVLGRAGRTTILLALGVAHSIALLVTMQRHTSGLLPGFLGEPRHVDFGRDIEWWWASAPHPDVVWMVASVAYLIVVVSVVRLTSTRSAETVPPGAGAASAA